MLHGYSTLGEAAQAIQDTSFSGIREQADRILCRVREIGGRVGSIGDGIFGSRPEPATGMSASNSPSLISVLHEIEREIGAIESALNRF